jgi:lycopene cyclase domain-containing protein
MAHLSYLGLLLACLCFTIPLDFVYASRVLARPVTLLRAIFPGFVVFIAWDLYAISRGQWTYDLRRMTGILLSGRLPLEEALFFLVIPLAAILTFEAIGQRQLRSADSCAAQPPARGTAR